MAEMFDVLILGGGAGGLVTANELRKKLPDKFKIALIDKSEQHLFYPSLLWLITGKRDENKIQKPLSLLKRKGIEFIKGEIVKIDPLNKQVNVDQKTYQGRFLVIALGADLQPESISGLSESGHNLYTLEGANEIKEKLKSFDSGHLVVFVAPPPYKCPAAPYEAMLLLEESFHKKGLGNKVKLSLYAGEAGPMGVAGVELSNAVRGLVENKGVEYYPEHILTEVKDKVLSFTNGKKVPFDLFFYVPPHKAPEVVKNAGLTDSSGWIPVNVNTLETSFKDIYAIGDITVIPLPLGKPLPKAGVFAHNEAEVVAHNIAVSLNNSGILKSFNGDGECFLEIGYGKAGYAKGNFYASPKPSVRMSAPGYRWHIGKIGFEKWWMWKWF